MTKDGLSDYEAHQAAATTIQLFLSQGMISLFRS
jgi:hypothetical protein